MNESRNAELSGLASAIRESSLKRLRQVPAGFENWKPLAGMLSFAELASHLIEADKWLFRKKLEKTLEPIKARAGSITIGSNAQYRELLQELSAFGEERCTLIGQLTQADWQEMFYDSRFGAEVSFWWLLVRGNLDHEIHHRGQISVYLRLSGLSSP